MPLLTAPALTAPAPAQEDLRDAFAGYWSGIKTVEMDYEITHERLKGLPPTTESGHTAWKTDDSFATVRCFLPLIVDGKLVGQAISERSNRRDIYRTVFTQLQLNGTERVVAAIRRDGFGWLRGQTLPHDYHCALPPVLTWSEACSDKRLRMEVLKEGPRIRVTPVEGGWSGVVELDPEKGHMPTRYRFRWRDGRTGYDLEVVKSAKVDELKWYPTELRRIDHVIWSAEAQAQAGLQAGAEVLRSTVIYKFTNVQLNNPLDQRAARWEFPPGTIVYDEIAGRTYVVPQPGEPRKPGERSDAGVDLLDPRQAEAVAAHISEVARLAREWLPSPSGGSAPTPSVKSARPKFDGWLEAIAGGRLKSVTRGGFLGGFTGHYCGVYCEYQAITLAGGDPPPLDQLCRAMKAETGVCSAEDLARTARELGFPEAHVRRAEPQDLASLPLPAVAYRHGTRPREGHFVLLARRHADLVQIIDYPRRVAWVPVERLSQYTDSWRGDVVLLQSYRPPTSGSPTAVAGLAGLSLLVGLVLIGRARVSGGSAVCPPTP